MKLNVLKGFRPNATDSKSVELRFMSVRVGLGVPKLNKKNFKISTLLKNLKLSIDFVILKIQF